jgi:hypothetical protein
MIPYTLSVSYILYKTTIFILHPETRFLEPPLEITQNYIAHIKYV